MKQLLALSVLACASLVQPPDQQKDALALAADLDKLTGLWLEAHVLAGDHPKGQRYMAEGFIFNGDKFTRRQATMQDSQTVNATSKGGTIKLDISAKPKTIDFLFAAPVPKIGKAKKGEVYLGIYDFEGDTLKVCFRANKNERPTTFDPKDKGNTVLILKQGKDGKKGP